MKKKCLRKKCQKEFEPNKPKQVFCSAKCRVYHSREEKKEVAAEVPVVEKVSKTKQAVISAPKKTRSFADYMAMSGKEIKENWDEIKSSKLTPGQRTTLYNKTL